MNAQMMPLRGKPVAKISPLDAEASVILQHEAFGMWKGDNPMSVADQVRSLRKGRFHDEMRILIDATSVECRDILCNSKQQ